MTSLALEHLLVEYSRFLGDLTYSAFGFVGFWIFCTESLYSSQSPA